MTREIIIPQDKEMEGWMLGACMTSKVHLYEICSALSEKDFHNIPYSKIFITIRQMNTDKSPVSEHTLALTLKQDGILSEVGGIEEVVSLAESVGFSVDVGFYIQELKKMSISRQLITESQKLCIAAQNPKNSEQVLHDHQKTISQIGLIDRGRFISLEEITRKYRGEESFEDNIRREVEIVKDGGEIFDGFRSGYKNLDRIIGGFGNGTNNIIGARSSAGKTTFLVNLFGNISKQYPNAMMGFFSLEMPKHKILDKILARMAGINVRSLDERHLDQREVEELTECANMIKKMKLGIYDLSGTTVHDICRATRHAVIKDNLKIIFIDYLSRIQGDRRLANKHMQIDDISKHLQNLALELNIPIVTLAQLNRNAAQRPDKTPQLTDLRESGSIEEDADLVLMLHRPAHYDKHVQDRTQVIVAKNRIRGDLGKVEYEFDNGNLNELDLISDVVISALYSEDKKESYARHNY